MNTRKIFTGLLTMVLAGLIALPLIAQKDEMKSYDEIEKTQDEIEAIYVQIYDIIEDYPKATYEYVYSDGDVASVMIENIGDTDTRKQLELYLMDLEEKKKDIFNMSNRVGIYYVAETEPVPEDGYDEFYKTVRNLLKYPESAEDIGVEGTVHVKFVVDEYGRISNASASEDINTESEWVVESMKKEAVEAVKATSGDWVPATIAGIPVAHWVVIPVQFKIDSPYYRPLLGSSE